jgi:hypothetical protein
VSRQAVVVMHEIHYICGVGVGVGVVSAPTGPGTQGWATVLVVTTAPGLLRLVLPITELAPPTVAPTAGMPVAGLAAPAVEVVPAAVAPALVVVVVVPGVHGPATVLMVDPTVLFVVLGMVPTGLDVAGTPPAVAGAATTGFWLGVVVVVWLGV